MGKNIGLVGLALVAAVAVTALSYLGLLSGVPRVVLLVGCAFPDRGALVARGVNVALARGPWPGRRRAPGRARALHIRRRRSKRHEGLDVQGAPSETPTDGAGVARGGAVALVELGAVRWSVSAGDSGGVIRGAAVALAVQQVDEVGGE